MARRMLLSYILLLPLLLAGCDNFSLPGQFKFLDLTLEKSVVHPGEQSTLTPLGGTPPYAATASAGSLYDDGVHQADPGSIQDMVYTAGSSIGSVTIRLSDSAGHSMEASISVLPWAPQDFIATGATSSPWQVTLTWAYTTPGYIGGFKLLRSKAGGPFEQVTDSITKSGGSWTCIDTGAANQMNDYRLSAFAGSNESDYVTASAKGKN